MGLLAGGIPPGTGVQFGETRPRGGGQGGHAAERVGEAGNPGPRSSDTQQLIDACGRILQARDYWEVLTIPPGASRAQVSAASKFVKNWYPSERLVSKAAFENAALSRGEELRVFGAAAVWGEAYAALREDAYREEYARAYVAERRYSGACAPPTVQRGERGNAFASVRPKGGWRASLVTRRTVCV